MFGKPVDAPKNAIFLRPHWKYDIKRNGTHRDSQFYDGSKRAAPMLRYLNPTYSSCVQYPAQRPLFAIAAHLDLHIYGGDASEAFENIPGPSDTTFVYIDDQFADWYRHKFGKDIYRGKVIPVLRYLKGHPESGHRWELPGNYPVFTVVMVIYHYVERICRITVTPIFKYNIYDHQYILSG